MENPKEKLLIYDRRTIAAMSAANRVLDRLSTISFSGGGATALASVMAGTKIDLLLPIIFAIVGAFSQAVRELLTYLVSVSEIRNPIKDA
ncbi:hypothetical protein WBJ53_26190 [Spirosoma sp. SC4-14]|uniref:hypothetical protein n=1 Tax=Spirosoma sp. SC4-14 TaxID=3128900 RepID=UPI0030D14C90